MHRIEDRLTHVKERIRQAAESNGRNVDDITLLGVSKKQSIEKIITAYNCGLKDIGENYLQEALDKQVALKSLTLRWHFIGPIQSNKTRAIAEHFDWVHSVDRLKIAQRLNEQRPRANGPLNICLQVNIDREKNKAGLAIDEVKTLVDAVRNMDALTLRGLMIIPSPNRGESSFQRTRELLLTINDKLDLELDTLSMGMSNDLELAIAEGATIVRIGSALFGHRT